MYTVFQAHLVKNVKLLKSVIIVTVTQFCTEASLCWVQLLKTSMKKKWSSFVYIACVLVCPYLQMLLGIPWRKEFFDRWATCLDSCLLILMTLGRTILISL